MRVIIPCAGRQTRWADSKTPKHLVKLCGEPVLHRRTVRLVNEFAPDADIKVVVEVPQDRRYQIPGSSKAKARLGAAAGDVDKIASSRHLWSAVERTLILFGDVWWSRPAMSLVFGGDDSTAADWWAFGRFGPNGNGGELFGFDVGPGDAEAADAAIAAATTAGNERGGWAFYRAMCGADPTDHRDHGHFVTIDDWTEDLDTRKDWDNWCWRYAHASDDERREQVG